MPRYRQIVNEDGSSTFVEIGRSAPKAHGVAVHGDIEAFVSPIDGSVIDDRKKYREHCKRHGVVPQAEFSDEFLAKKRAERERHYKGASERERKQALYDAIIRAEREAGW